MFYYSIASVTSFGALDNGCLTISVGMLWLLLIFGIYGIYCICSPSLFAYIQQERCVIIKIGEWDLAVIHLLLLQRSKLYWLFTEINWLNRSWSKRREADGTRSGLSYCYYKKTSSGAFNISSNDDDDHGYFFNLD